MQTPAYCTSLASVAMIEYPDSKRLGEKVISVHGSGAQFIIWGNSKRERHAATHITTTVKSKEKWMHDCAQLELPSVIQFRTPYLGNGAVHSGVDLPRLLSSYYLNLK